MKESTAEYLGKRIDASLADARGPDGIDRGPTHLLGDSGEIQRDAESDTWCATLLLFLVRLLLFVPRLRG